MSKKEVAVAKAPVAPTVVEPTIVAAIVDPSILDGLEPRSDEELLAEAKRIAESEKPRIEDAAVHNLGQDGKNYGNVQSVREVFYEAHDRKTNSTVARKAIRIDH